MEVLMRDHLRSEDERAAGIVSDESVIEETWNTFVSLKSRLTPLSYKAIRSYADVTSENRYRVISLNYTSTIDRLMKAVSEAHKPFRTRSFASSMYTDTFNGVLHIHGTLEDEGGLIFGVSDESQIANDEFSKSEEFQDQWIKRNRNVVYGNERSDQAQSIIGNTDLFILYGCSIGPTDRYIWQWVINRMIADSNVRLLVFDYGAPLRGGLEVKALKIEERRVRDAVLQSLDPEDQHREGIAKRIRVESASYAFQFAEARKGFLAKADAGVDSVSNESPVQMG